MVGMEMMLWEATCHVRTAIERGGYASEGSGDCDLVSGIVLVLSDGRLMVASRVRSSRATCTSDFGQGQDFERCMLA